MDIFENHDKDELGYQNFVVFELAAQRIDPADVLVQGPEVRVLFDKLTNALYRNSGDLSDMIIVNRLNRIGMMLDMVKNYENVLISKFLNRVWKRYSYFSNLGENLLDMETFLTAVPEYKDDPNLVAYRIDMDEPLMIADSDDESDEDSETESEEETLEEVAKKP